MFKYFPSIGSKGKDIKGLLKNSISLLGKDADVFKPAIYMTMVKSMRIIVFFYGFYCFLISKDYGKGAISILCLLLLVPIVSYFKMKYKAMTSWMIYEVLRGEDTDVSSGKKNIQGLRLTIFLYSLVDIVLSRPKNSNSKNDSGIAQALIGFALIMFEEVWDLVKNFSLPAIVIDKVKLKEVPQRLKVIKKNIPASLAGILGLDLVGGMIVSLLSSILLPVIIVGAAIGYYLKAYLPQQWLINLPFENFSNLNILPVFIFAIGGAVFVSFLNSLVQLVKTTYFTTFYVSLVKPSEISSQLRSEVANYLNFNHKLDGYTLFESQNEKEEGYDLDSVTGEDLKLLKRIAHTFKKNIAKGMSEEKIYSALKRKGYSEDQLNCGLKMYKAS